MTIERSVAESKRFGMNVARVVVQHDRDLDAVAGCANDFDVLIVRAPADRSSVAVRLTAVSGFRLLPADHLMVWERVVPVRAESVLPAGWSIETPQYEHDVVDVVRDAFEGYRSHYAMNPLFDAQDVLDGYCEWAATMYADEQVATLVVFDEHRVPVGVGLLDFAPDTPDIRLAGMRSLVQGLGHYSALMTALGDVAEARGATGIQISTQSTNVRVMRAWAWMDFVPRSTVATYHLTRSSLLDRR